MLASVASSNRSSTAKFHLPDEYAATPTNATPCCTIYRSECRYDASIYVRQKLELIEKNAALEPAAHELTTGDRGRRAAQRTAKLEGQVVGCQVVPVEFAPLVEADIVPWPTETVPVKTILKYTSEKSSPLDILRNVKLGERSAKRSFQVLAAGARQAGGSSGGLTYIIPLLESELLDDEAEALVDAASIMVTYDLVEELSRDKALIKRAMRAAEERGQEIAARTPVTGGRDLRTIFGRPPAPTGAGSTSASSASASSSSSSAAVSIPGTSIDDMLLGGMGMASAASPGTRRMAVITRKARSSVDGAGAGAGGGGATAASTRGKGAGGSTSAGGNRHDDGLDQMVDGGGGGRPAASTGAGAMATRHRSASSSPAAPARPSATPAAPRRNSGCGAGTTKGVPRSLMAPPVRDISDEIGRRHKESEEERSIRARFESIFNRGEGSQLSAAASLRSVTKAKTASRASSAAASSSSGGGVSHPVLTWPPRSGYEDHPKPEWWDGYALHPWIRYPRPEDIRQAMSERAATATSGCTDGAGAPSSTSLDVTAALPSSSASASHATPRWDWDYEWYGEQLDAAGWPRPLLRAINEHSYVDGYRVMDAIEAQRAISASNGGSGGSGAGGAASGGAGAGTANGRLPSLSPLAAAARDHRNRLKGSYGYDGSGSIREEFEYYGRPADSKRVGGASISSVGNGGVASVAPRARSITAAAAGSTRQMPGKTGVAAASASSAPSSYRAPLPPVAGSRRTRSATAGSLEFEEEDDDGDGGTGSEGVEENEEPGVAEDEHDSGRDDDAGDEASSTSSTTSDDSRGDYQHAASAHKHGAVRAWVRLNVVAGDAGSSGAGGGGGAGKASTRGAARGSAVATSCRLPDPLYITWGDKSEKKEFRARWGLLHPGGHGRGSAGSASAASVIPDDDPYRRPRPHVSPGPGRAARTAGAAGGHTTANHQQTAARNTTAATATSPPGAPSSSSSSPSTKGASYLGLSSLLGTVGSAWQKLGMRGPTANQDTT